MAWPPPGTRAAVIGSFLPPTTADALVMAFVSSWHAEVEVVLLSGIDDPIASDLRAGWLAALAPAARVRQLEVRRDAGDIDDRLRTALAGTSLLVGANLDDVDIARRLGLEYVPVPIPWANRDPVDVRATAWPPFRAQRACLDAHSVRRVVVLGPESTGKTTLASDLAQRYDTVWLPEYLRVWLDAKGSACEPEDLPKVVSGHQASEAALAHFANRVLLCDTDPLMTAVYSGFYYGDVPEWLDAAAGARRADAYLLLDTDVPWVADPQRDMPHRRDEIRERCQRELARRGLAWTLVSGTWQERLAAACAVVDRVLAVPA